MPDCGGARLSVLLGSGACRKFVAHECGLACRQGEEGAVILEGETRTNGRAWSKSAFCRCFGSARVSEVRFLSESEGRFFHDCGSRVENTQGPHTDNESGPVIERSALNCGVVRGDLYLSGFRGGRGREVGPQQKW